jgi:hypothetical protein
MKKLWSDFVFILAVVIVLGCDAFYWLAKKSGLFRK